MIAARLFSALRDAGAQRTQSVARLVEGLLGETATPLASAMDAERHEINTADAGTISYYADTRAAGRPLVLLHGIHAAGSAYDMRPLFESFRGQRPVYALDLPGFGFSERASRAYTPATYVHAIEHLLRNVAMAQGADVIALSLSSEYAAKVAVEMPDIVRSLVLISPTGFASRRELGRLERRARATNSERAARLSSLPLGQLLYHPLVSRPSLRHFLGRSFEQRIDDGLLAYAYATSHQPGAWRAPCAFIAGALFPSGEPRQLYARVHVPTLVLYDQDAYTGFGELSSFVTSHANFQAERISHTRGLPQFDAPQQTAEALRRFFKKLERSEGADKADGHATTMRFIGSA